MKGIDYSFARPPLGDVKAQGYDFVMRYLSSSGSGKVIDVAEAKAIRGEGLALGLVYEDQADRALAGKSAGTSDAKVARAQADAIGFPKDRPIYFAVDFDASEAQQAAIDAYMDGAADVLTSALTGVYGGFYVIERTKHAAWYWQTLAWSGGQISKRAHLYQNGQHAFADGADVNLALQSDYGAWGSEGDMGSGLTLTDVAVACGFDSVGSMKLRMDYLAGLNDGAEARTERDPADQSTFYKDGLARGKAVAALSGSGGGEGGTLPPGDYPVSGTLTVPA